jgi:hypothetical protein
MTAAITTLRTTIATALVDNTKYSTFAFPPSTPIANSVTVNPSDPYIVPNNNARNNISPMANFDLHIFLPLLDNEGNLNGIEETVVAVFNKLAASSLTYNIGSVSAPSVVNAVSGDLLSCTVQLSILTSWS